jgi:hypothetical protein
MEQLPESILEPKFPKWEADNFMGVEPEFDTPSFRLRQAELLGIAYFKHQRDYVIKKRFSFLGSFDGRHRSGKSITAACFGYLWDDTFVKYFENRIVQDHHEFIDAIDKIASSGVKGAVIMVDEAGVAMSSADWYERWLKTIVKMVQMFGYLYPVVLFVAPVKDFVDSRLRRMFHAYYKMERYTLENTTITPYDLKYNTVRQKFFYKKPVIRLGTQEIVLRRIIMGRPPDEILERYGTLEQARKKVMFNNFIEEMKREDIKEVKETVNLDNVIDHVANKYQLYESKRSKPDNIMLDENKIEFGFKIPNRMAKYVKGKAEDKIRDSQRELKEKLERGTK